jgi:hypothetical protein
MKLPPSRLFTFIRSRILMLIVLFTISIENVFSNEWPVPLSEAKLKITYGRRIKLFKNNGLIYNSKTPPNHIKDDQSDAEVLYFESQADHEYELSVPYSFTLEPDSLYRLKFDFYTDFTLEEFDKIKFLVKLPSKSRPVYATYHQLSRFDLKTTEIGWQTMEIDFLGQKLLKELRIQFTDASMKSFFAVKNVSVSEVEFPKDQKNLITNGDFEYNCRVSEFSRGVHASYCVGWRDVYYTTHSCYVNNEGLVNLNGLPEMVSVHNMTGYEILPDENRLTTSLLGGIISFNQYFLLDSLVPYSGRYCAVVETDNKWQGKEFEGGQKNSGSWLEIKLKRQLEAGKRYLFTMYYRFSKQSETATNSLGILFTNCTYIRQDFTLGDKYNYANASFIISNAVITSCNEWQKFSCEYVADGSEKYITIGPFLNNSIPYKEIKVKDGRKRKLEPSNYYFDKVSLVEIEYNN